MSIFLYQAIMEGLYSALPAFGSEGRLYFATDTKQILYDTGSAWQEMLSAPTATTSSLGLVEPDGVTIDVAAGVISVPTATTGAKGIVKPDGTTIDVSAGVISVPTATTGAKGIVKPDGTTIDISAGVISAAAMVGDSGSGGSAGIVPAPGAGTATAGKFLKADGSWQVPPGSGGSGVGVIHTGGGPPPAGTPASIALVQSATSGSSSTTKAFGSNVTAGNLLIVITEGESGYDDTPVPTDTVGTEYQVLQTVVAGGVIGVTIFGGVAPASGANTVTGNIPDTGITNPGFLIAEFSGVCLAVDVLGGSDLGTFTPSIAMITGYAGELLIAACATIWTGGAATFTVGSGFTLAAHGQVGAASQNGLALEYVAGATAGSHAAAIAITGLSGGASNTNFQAISLLAVVSGTPGADGDFYLDLADGVLYGPRVGGNYIPVALAANLPLATDAVFGLVKGDGSTIVITAGVASATSGGSGALTQIGQVVVGSPAASIAFSGIPGSYSSLHLVLNGASSSGSSDNVQMQFNGDAGANYAYEYEYNGSYGGATGAIFALLGTLGSDTLTNDASNASCLIPTYAGTVFNKNFRCGGYLFNGSAGELVDTAGSWFNTAAINAILLTLSSGGNFVAGTVATLYGMQ